MHKYTSHALKSLRMYYSSKLDVMGIEAADLERHLLRQNQPASLLFKSDILSILKLILLNSAKVNACMQTLLFITIDSNKSASEEAL